MTSLDSALISSLAASLDETAVFIFGAIAVVFIVGILSDSLRKVLQTRHHEQSRREIAAYVAEGSISPEDGERLIRAGRRASSKK